jgi:hypothetical protein
MGAGNRRRRSSSELLLRPAAPIIRAVATTVTDARRALLGRLIDHAALFPPASMSIADALAEDARVRSSDEGWLVGRFVVPASRISELGDVPLQLSVVRDAPLPDDERIEAVELPPGADPVGLAGEVYVEVPFEQDQASALKRLAERGLCAKLRCGGSFTPSVRQLAAAIRGCRELGLPFKATAGLHHAVRRGSEHGFLNLLAAAVFGDEEHALSEEDAGAFPLTRDGFGWRGRWATGEDVARMRRDLFAGFGSCSLAEPIDELRALAILRA